MARLPKESYAPVRGRDFVEMTRSCGCLFCDLKMEPVKLRRRWVHHIPKRGQLVPCAARNLKPVSAA